MFLSLLVITLVMLALAYFVLPTLEKVTPSVTVQYSEPSLEDDDTTDKPQVMLPSKPVPPASSSAPSTKMIVSQSFSAVSIPTMDTANEVETIEFGTGLDDFGDGWAGIGENVGTGAGGGAFGSKSKIASALKGNLYDFKQDSKGEARKYDVKGMDFAEVANDIQRSKFSDSAFRKFFKAPQDLYLTHLAIPNSDASAGPKFFDAEKEVQPSGWLANYQGTVVAPENGTFRFVGIGDDYLSVFVNGRPRLFGSFATLQGAVSGRWKGSDTNPSHLGPIGNKPLIYGDWIRVKKGEAMELNIAVGERPGGKVGFVLLIQKKDQKYELEPSNGRPILPLFTTVPIPEDRKQEIVKEFGNFRFDWEHMGVWGGQ